MPAEGGAMKRLLPNHTEPHFDGHFSRDGKRIVYVYDQLQGTDGKLRINTCAADGSDDQTLIPHKAFEESPRFSPDGKTVLWVSTRDGNPDLYTITADRKTVKRLTNDPAYDLHPTWKPDGTKIAFASGRSGKQKIHLMSADGSGVTKLTDGEFLDAWPAWRPNGKQIAFVSNRTGNFDVWLMTAEGKELVNLTANKAQDTSPAWHPEGKKLAFVSTRGGGSDIFVMEGEVTRRVTSPRELLEFDVVCLRAAGNGKRQAVVRLRVLGRRSNSRRRAEHHRESLPSPSLLSRHQGHDPQACARQSSLPRAADPSQCIGRLGRWVRSLLSHRCPRTR